MLTRIVWNRIDYLYKKKLALNNLEGLICHKTQPTNQLISSSSFKDNVTNKLFTYVSYIKQYLALNNHQSFIYY